MTRVTHGVEVAKVRQADVVFGKEYRGAANSESMQCSDEIQMDRDGVRR